MKVNVHTEEWVLKQAFEITGHVWHTVPCLVVELIDDNHSGRGEAQGVYYLDETADSMLAQVEAIIPAFEARPEFNHLQELLPAGGARNALDCALWDLHCKQVGKTIWEQLERTPRPIQSVLTIGLEAEPEQMAEKARQTPSSHLKVKLNDDRPAQRLEAIMNARPDASIVVDANQGWTIDTLNAMIEQFNGSALTMIEQPLPRGNDLDLKGLHSPIPIAADESCLNMAEIYTVSDRYDVINIKLDKCGGLTEALGMIKTAQSLDLDLMVGNMTGTSLAMAPAFVVAQFCQWADIDGPTLLRYDRPHALHFDNGLVSGISPALWG